MLVLARSLPASRKNCSASALLTGWVLMIGEGKLRRMDLVGVGQAKDGTVKFLDLLNALNMINLVSLNLLNKLDLL